MHVAINGDKAAFLSQRLAPGTHLVAVANGFGDFDGQPVAPAALARIRVEFERRSKGDRLRRHLGRAKAITNAMTAALTRVNAALHLRSASHEDYVTAACSLTAAVLIDERVFLSHVGSTAAYLARDGYVVSLTKTDAFDGEGMPVLTQALGVAPAVDCSVCSFKLGEGDTLILARRAARDADERRALSEALIYGQERAEAGQLLVVKYASGEQSSALAPAALGIAPVVTGVLATVLFYAMLCIR